MPKVIHTFLFAGVIAISQGCATPYALTQKQPQIEYTSPKSPKELASIISLEWSKHTSSVNTIISGDGYIISILHPYAGADATVSILPSGRGSSVRYSERIPSLSPNWMQQAILLCKPPMSPAP